MEVDVRNRLVGVALGSALLLASSSGAVLWAQTDELSSEQVAPQQVESMVRSLMGIQPLLEAASRELQVARSEVEEQAIEREFVKTASEIVEQEGLTVSLYSQLMTLANHDPEFRDRIAYQLDLLNARDRPQYPSPPTTEPPRLPRQQQLPLNHADSSSPSMLR